MMGSNQAGGWKEWWHLLDCQHFILHLQHCLAFYTVCLQQQNTYIQYRTKVHKFRINQTVDFPPQKIAVLLCLQLKTVLVFLLHKRPYFTVTRSLSVLTAQKLLQVIENKSEKKNVREMLISCWLCPSGPSSWCTTFRARSFEISAYKTETEIMVFYELDNLTL